MSDGYTPQRGSIAEKVIEHLTAQPAALDTNAIAKLIDCKRTSVSTSLKAAVEAGLLVTTKDGNRLIYSLADEPGEAPPSDGKLTIANWSDGDVTVQGGTLNDNDSVTYTREQLLQLFNYLTTPHLAVVARPAVQE